MAKTKAPKGIVFWLGWILPALSISFVMSQFPRVFPAIDFNVFWMAANAPVEALYHTELFVNPPTALIWLAPLKLAPMWWAYLAWSAASVAAFYLASPYPKAVTWLSLATPVAVIALIVGQMTLLLSALIFLAIRFRIGALIGLVITIKPQLALLAPLVFLVRADWRMLAGVAMGAAFNVGLSMILFGPAMWLDWLAWVQAWNAGKDLALARLFGIPFLPMWFVSAGLSVAAALAFGRKADGGALVALIVFTSVMAAPYALVYDLTAAMPFLVSAGLAWNQRRRDYSGRSSATPHWA